MYQINAADASSQLSKKRQSRLLHNIVLALLMLFAVLMTVPEHIKADSEPVRLPIAYSVNGAEDLTLKISSVDKSGDISMVLANSTDFPVKLLWNEYSTPKLLGQFHIVVKDDHGNSLAMKVRALRLFEIRRVYDGEVFDVRRLIIPPHSSQQTTINLCRLFEFAVFGNYTVSVSRVREFSVDEELHSAPGKTSNETNFVVTSLSKQPAFTMTYPDPTSPNFADKEINDD